MTSNKKLIFIVISILIFLLLIGGIKYYFLANKNKTNIIQKKEKNLEEETTSNEKKLEEQTTTNAEKIDGECGEIREICKSHLEHRELKGELCKKGIYKAENKQWPNLSWWCMGVNGGDDQFCSCSIDFSHPEGGECGEAINATFPVTFNALKSTISSINYYNPILCKGGTTPSLTAVGNKVSWKCYGVNNGGRSVTCSVDLPTEEEVKKYFNATEIVSNGFASKYPENHFIIFYTQKKCPYSGEDDSYKPPEDYYVSAAYCPENGVKDQEGQIRGISKIVLRKKSEFKSTREKLLNKTCNPLSKPDSFNLDYSRWIEIAPVLVSYCSHFDVGKYYQAYTDIFWKYLNADLDNDKEILVVCDAANFRQFAVLDKQNDKWVVLVSDDTLICPNEGWLSGINVKDYDNDGIDEITYDNGGAGAWGETTDIYSLYSFTDRKWFTCIYKKEYEEPGGKNYKESFICEECPPSYGPDPWQRGCKKNENISWRYDLSQNIWIKKH
jgi:hypothetical protein